MNYRRYLPLFLKGSFGLAFIMLAFLAARGASGSEAVLGLVADYGYAGVFLAAIISGINLVVPVPIVSFMPLFLEAGLDFWLTVAFISAGMTVGDTVGYFLGWFGRDIPSPGLRRIVERLTSYRERHYWLPLSILFIFASAAPFPNEVLVLPLALMGYRLIALLPFMLAGNFIFNTWAAAGLTGIFERLF